MDTISSVHAPLCYHQDNTMLSFSFSVLRWTGRPKRTLKPPRSSRTPSPGASVSGKLHFLRDTLSRAKAPSGLATTDDASPIPFAM
jgi:hypothetical protein